MTSTDQTPKLPLWLYYVTDAALLGAGFIIARFAHHPLSPAAIFSITACVIAGGIVLLIPLIVHFERQKNELLDERQRALETLARTIGASAEQIGIATSGLHEIVDIAQKILRHAEQLPHKLQEKIAEFQALTVDAGETEKEELEKELVALRTSESERLEAVSNKIAKTAAELVKLEAASQQHLAAANEAIAKLSFGTAAAIGKAQAAAEQALTQARTEAARGVGEAAGTAAHSIESAKAAALSELDAKLASASAAFAERVSRDLIAKLQAKDTPPGASEKTAPADPAGATEDSPKAEGTAHPPKRPRKPRREEAATDPAPVETAAAGADPTKAIAMEEPAPLPATAISEVAPVAPHTAEPFSGHVSTAPAEPAPADAPKEPKKRAARKIETPAPAAPAAEAASADAPDEFRLVDDATGAGSSVAERVLTSDGATRLLVTAYIGIGNRLFIRGSGPGLTWEKGVPLQFVSIGKWRWETNDASGPVQFKLYKNDSDECAALGSQAIEPGYQQEVTAAF